MADNETTGSGKAVATDKATYSGDADQNIQLIRPVQTTGSEGSKTVVDWIGEVQATPTSNTLLARLKDLLTGIVLAVGDNIIGRVKVTDGTNLATVTNSALQVTGGVAHDGADAGNPIKMGARAIAYVNQTAVAANDRSDLYCDRHGSLFVVGGHPDVVTLEAAYTAAQTDTAIVTISTGSKIVVTQVQLVTDNANTAFPSVRVGFGGTNTPTTTGVVLTHPGVPAGGGISRGDGSGILGVGADGEDLRITCGAPTGGSLRVLVTYYTIPS